MNNIEFPTQQITVRSGKDAAERMTMLPDSLAKPLKRQFEKTRTIHEQDLTEGFEEVYLPYALARKYPNVALFSVPTTPS